MITHFIIKYLNSVPNGTHHQEKISFIWLLLFLFLNRSHTLTHKHTHKHKYQLGEPRKLVDASAAGEGQLEISINEGEVPNHVQVVGGGRCLVSFTPEQAKPHYIDIKFNGETVNGCPFVCSVADTSRVLLNLSNLGNFSEIDHRKEQLSKWLNSSHRINTCK